MAGPSYDEILAALQPRVRVIRDFAQWLHGHSIPDHVEPITDFDGVKSFLAVLDPVRRVACGLIAARMAFQRHVPDEDAPAPVDMRKWLDTGFAWFQGAAPRTAVATAQQAAKSHGPQAGGGVSSVIARALELDAIDAEDTGPPEPEDVPLEVVERSRGLVSFESWNTMQRRRWEWSRVRTSWEAVRAAWQYNSPYYDDVYRSRFLRDWYGRCLGLLAVAGTIECDRTPPPGSRR